MSKSKFERDLERNIYIFLIFGKNDGLSISCVRGKQRGVDCFGSSALSGKNLHLLVGVVSYRLRLLTGGG